MTIVLIIYITATLIILTSVLLCYSVTSACIDSQKYGHAVEDIYNVDLFVPSLAWNSFC